jgi:sugar O-acyltransferase (sialic acid O-acetyltransferase NeuD family)
MSTSLKKTKRLLIIGCGGHSKVVSEIAEEVGFKEISYLITEGNIDTFLGRMVTTLFPVNYNEYFFVAIGDNSKREALFRDFLKRNPKAIGVSLIHPSSIIASNCTIGPGSVIMPLSIINTSSTLGTGVIINTKSSVDHDSNLKDFSSLAPGVTMGGGVNIGKRSAICIGATVKNGIQIGKDAIVGASSLVLNDIDDNWVVYGVPAKPIRKRYRGESYL